MNELKNRAEEADIRYPFQLLLVELHWNSYFHRQFFLEKKKE